MKSLLLLGLVVLLLCLLVSNQQSASHSQAVKVASKERLTKDVLLSKCACADGKHRPSSFDYCAELSPAHLLGQCLLM